MKRTLLLLFTALMNWTMASAQAQPSVDEGYVFVTNLKSYSKKSLKSRTRSVIPAGHVAIATENNMFRFPCVDAAEYIILRSGAFHEYYPPAQEEVPPEFISRAAFNKAVRKVNISSQVPSSWELGKVYSFKPVSSLAYFKSITVKPLRLSSSDVTLVTMVDDNFQPTSSINISGKTIVKIEFEDNTVYLYDGREIVLDTNDSGEHEYRTLVIDDNGVTFSQNENGACQPTSKLSYVFGAYPDVDYFGWISDKEIVVDNLLCVPTSPSTTTP